MAYSETAPSMPKVIKDGQDMCPTHLLAENFVNSSGFDEGSNAIYVRTSFVMNGFPVWCQYDPDAGPYKK